MSELNQIADILRDAIKSRQTLAVGEAQFAAVQGQSALFTTSSGVISAIATNFCYGSCLLARVEGKWYALNPADNRQVIRSNVDRMIQRKPKNTDGLPKISIVAGIKISSGYYGGGSTIIYPSFPVSIPEDGGSLMFKFEIEEASDTEVVVVYELAGSAVFNVNYQVGSQTPTGVSTLPAPTINGGSIAFPAGVKVVELELLLKIVDPRLAAPVSVEVAIAPTDDYDPDDGVATTTITTRLIRYQSSSIVNSEGLQPTSAPTCPLPPTGYAFVGSELIHGLEYRYIDPDPTYIGFVKHILHLEANNADPPIYTTQSDWNPLYGNEQALIGFIPYSEIVNGSPVNRVANYDRFLYAGSNPVGDFNSARAAYLASGFIEEIRESWYGTCNYIEI